MGEYISCIYTKALADGETIDMFYFFFLIFFFLASCHLYTLHKESGRDSMKRKRIGWACKIFVSNACRITFVERHRPGRIGKVLMDTKLHYLSPTSLREIQKRPKRVKLGIVLRL